MDIKLFPHSLLETVLPPLTCFDTFVRNLLAACVGVSGVSALFWDLRAYHRSFAETCNNRKCILSFFLIVLAILGLVCVYKSFLGF